jgi:hypothetical protein
MDGQLASSAAFGCIVPGRLPQFNFAQIDTTKWMTPLGATPEFVVVFLTGIYPIPDGFGLGVYLSIEATAYHAGTYEYIGCLTNETPSSTFRVPASFFAVDGAHPISLGLQMQTLGMLQNIGETTAQPMQQRDAATLIGIARKLSDDLYNFMCSYARTLSNDPSDPACDETIYMPMRWANTWRERVERKFTKDASFWSQ